ncbi:MAG: phosphoglycerate kinase [Simkaniaceae bacterium]|nr:phosphoglycerate kinase [Simkaniaceae bacterium]
MAKLTLQDVDVSGKRVLMRVDFNVPVDSEGKINDDTRIRLAMPSIRYVISEGGKLILMSHFGRPKGERKPEFSLSPIAKRLSAILNHPVTLAPDCIGDEVEALVAGMKPGDVLLLENLRFYPEEAKPKEDHAFAGKLAKLGDIYVNDAFGAAHRKHSSTYFICDSFPGKCVAGFLVEKEINYLSGALSNPKRPFYAIVGGAKISTKIGVLEALADKVDGMFIGGAMAYTFYLAMGIKVGASLVDNEHIVTAKALLDRGVKIWLPIDSVIAESIESGGQSKVVEKIPEGWMGLDIGPKTVKEWESACLDAKTIFWNGPVGVFEVEAFQHGTFELARFIAKLSATTIVGGGDSTSAINKLGLIDRFDHVSTGGGASLEYIEQGHLPAIDKLSDK